MAALATPEQLLLNQASSPPSTCGAGPNTCRSMASTTDSTGDDAMAVDEGGGGAPASSEAAHCGMTAADAVLLSPPGGQQVWASRQQLVERTAFFSRALADDEPNGPAAFSSAAIEHLATALAPGARAALPSVLHALGSSREDAAQELLSARSVFHVFAVAHLLGATTLLEAAREWVAAHQNRLSAALSELDAESDNASLRVAADYGLDRLCNSRMIHAAVAADMVASVRVLLAGDEASTDNVGESLVDVRDNDGRTPLHVSALHDSAGCAALLLQASADIEALCDPVEKDEDNEMEGDRDGSIAGVRDADQAAVYPGSTGIHTPLHLAAISDSSEVAQLLLDARANVAACVRGAQNAVTPLHECAASEAVRVAQILAPAAAAAAVEAGDQIMAEVASALQPSSLSTEGSQERGAAVDAEMADAESAANATGDVKWSKFLDPLNAKVGLNGFTPLHTAAEGDAPGVVAALLEAKADPGITDDQGDTPVHCAVLYGSPRALAELVARGASLVEENHSGELPLHVLAEFGEGDADERQLAEPMLRRHFARSIRTQELLIEALRHSGQLTNALAHRAAGDRGNSPLHAVARWQHLGAINAVQLLCAARADLEAENDDGWTPLAVACRHDTGNSPLAEVLRSLGAREPPPEVKDPLAGALGGCVRHLTGEQASAAQTASQAASNISSVVLPLQP